MQKNSTKALTASLLHGVANTEHHVNLILVFEVYCGSRTGLVEGPCYVAQQFIQMPSSEGGQGQTREP